MHLVRKAQACDAEAVFALRNAAIKAACNDFYAVELIRLWTAGDTPTSGSGQAVQEAFYVVELDGKVVGSCAIDLPSGKADAIFVAPNHMRKGIGRDMLALLERLAITAGLKTLHLESTLNAVEFYSRHGFERIREGKYESPRGFSLACVVMCKRLSASSRHEATSLPSCDKL